MIEAELADGRILEFPDGTDPAVIQETVRKLLSDSPAEAAQGTAQAPTEAAEEPGFDPASFALPDQEPGIVERIGADIERRVEQFDEVREATRSGEQTLPEGVLQTVGTAAGGALDVAGEVGESLIDTAGDIASFVTPDDLEDFIVEGTNDALEWALTSEIGQIGLDAARQGMEAYQEFAEENPRAARNIESVFNIGLIAAPATGAIRAGSQLPRFTRRQLRDLPDADEFFDVSTAKYKSARQSGSVLDSDDFVDYLSDFERATDGQIDAALHPQLAGVLNLLDRRIGNDLDMDDLMIIRRQMGTAIDTPNNPDQQRLALILRDNFDEFVEGLPGNDDWVEARRLYQQARKVETVDEALDRASRRASGIENGIRIEFDKILNSPKRSRGFSKEEKDVMRSIVEGDLTRNNLRRLSRLGFGSGRQTNVLTGLGGLAVGNEAAGGLGAATSAIAGQISGIAARNRAQRAANTLQALISGEVPRAAPTRTGRVLRRGALATAVSEVGPEDEENE